MSYSNYAVFHWRSSLFCYLGPFSLSSDISLLIVCGRLSFQVNLSCLSLEVVFVKCLGTLWPGPRKSIAKLISDLTIDCKENLLIHGCYLLFRLF